MENRLKHQTRNQTQKAAVEQYILTHWAEALWSQSNADLLPAADPILVDAELFLVSAAKLGFFAKTQFLSHPGHEPIDQKALHQLEKRDYQVRQARAEDLGVLQSLEALCWEEGLQTSAEGLAKRLQDYPEGQFVLVFEEQVVGVIYSQRIADTRVLYGKNAANVAVLRRNDGPIVQLLAINISPQVQQRQWGDQLLEFMLQRCAVMHGVEAVAAVTLARDYHKQKQMPMGAYIHHRTEQGWLADPILHFHELHGADIIDLIPQYRPKDVKNEGFGVLVSYDIHHRKRRNIESRTSRNEAGGEAPSLPQREHTLEAISDYLEEAVKTILGPEQECLFSKETPLMEMGLDSADFLGLREQIAVRFQTALEPTFFFQSKTPQDIISYFAKEMYPHPEKEAKATPLTATSVQAAPSHSRQGHIAIVGLACRLPGGIETPQALWQLLKNGESAVGSLPSGRWNWPADIDPDNRHRGIDQGGFLDDIAGFDAAFFRLSTTEVESMDPQQRMLLELSWQVLEDAGYAPKDLKKSQTGVFIGASGSDYSYLLNQSPVSVEAHFGTGSAMAVLANRISYFYDFYGPSLVVDTACSSSLVAVHKAVQSLRVGECDQVLVGGVHVMCHPANSLAYYQAGMLAKDGKCKTFDQQANGYVRAEGAVMLLLKPLEAAVADQDQVFAVIRGTSCNHGGLASGLTVPNPEQQAALLQQAWRDARISPLELSYLEAHGTGTALGDPIEIQGMKDAFAGYVKARSLPVPEIRSCGLGSIKTNLGHLEAAAGIAGLLKVVLAFRHRELPPLLHFKQLNDHIDLANTPFYPVDQLRSWDVPEGAIRKAGVSSFGSGGTNSHVVLEEYPQRPARPITPKGPLIFVLSARNQENLRAYAQKFLDWLRGEKAATPPLREMIYTLQVGRQAMEQRLALAVSDIDDLCAQLTRFCGGHDMNDELPEMAVWWKSGEQVDWASLYKEETRPRRISLPTYPFAHEAYWPAIVQPTREVRELLLAPVWSPVPFPLTSGITPPPSKKTVVVGANPQQQQWIQQVYPQALCLEDSLRWSVQAWEDKWRELEGVDHIIWAGSDQFPESIADEQLVQEQEAGILQVFRMVKSLLALDQDRVAISWTLITTQTQPVHFQERINPTHAAIHGFAGCLAKEYPRWHVRLFDVAAGTAWPVQEMFACEPQQGKALAYRGSKEKGGQWFQQELLPLQTSVQGGQERLPYRQNGVYVVIGGAGGLGEIWSRWMVETYQARIIWIGRREKDDEIQGKMDALSPAPHYIAADASDREALQRAYAEIRQCHPRIHGVVHSAVGSFDLSLAEISEERFRQILAVKVDLSLRIAQVFAQERLDFALFFSSVLSFLKSSGVSGYTAGCCFKDAFARQLAHAWSCPVKVMNWGYWRVGTGARISKAVKIRATQSGFETIDASEAMQALNRLLHGPIDQLLFLKTNNRRPLDMIQPEQTISCFESSHLSSIEAMMQRLDESPSDPQSRIKSMSAASIFKNEDMEPLLLKFLAGIVASKPVIRVPFYQNWLLQSERILREKGIANAADFSLETCWQEWESARKDWLQDANKTAALTLVETCLRAFSDILAGKRKATDVMFPHSSMTLVEGIYKNNLVSDYFNQVLGDVLVAFMTTRGHEEPVRILEIGAGTGGTTATLLEKLRPFQEQIAAYCYTDVSKAFLFHAEEHFAPEHPFIGTAIFDVEQPLANGVIKPADYDIVIATNVLHATKNICETLRNAKAALKQHGLMLLNELSDQSLFAHLTFGLLEGWWRHEDASIRIPGSPGLFPEAWQSVLEREGFTSVCFPARAAHQLGQQIIVAESNGIVRQQPLAPGHNAPSIRQPTAGSEPRRLPGVKTQKDRSQGMLREACTHYFQTLIGKVLRIESQRIDPAESLEAYGIDSILIVQIIEALQEIFEDVSSTLFFEVQTVDALVTHFLQHQREALIALMGIDEFTDSEPSEEVVAPAASVRGAPSNRLEREPIAIIGMSGHYPMADTPDAFWEMLKNGQDCIREIPPDRWPLEGFYLADQDQAVASGKSYSKWGGFLENPFDFDARFFNISPKEAKDMDPQERIFLQAAWEALEDAGYDKKSLATRYRQRVGVFVGITRTGFDLYGPQLWEQGNTAYPHTSFSSVANRISYLLDLRGPSMPIDTMCSSSLTAIHEACQRIQFGECEMAFAGGVNLYVHASSYVGLCASRMLSKDGRCKSFGTGSNGFVPGEGVGVVLLKPLSQAIKDHDPIHAVVRGTYVNHGGKTHGYTVPNPNAQGELIREALNRAGVHARTVSYVEAHGTGTELGDPIEVTGLTQAFRQETQDSGFCALGSVKSNIGHLESAAAMAGLTKIILQMKHGMLAPSLHARELNPKIPFEKTPFVIQQELAPWQRPTVSLDGDIKEYPRIAGISSFGAGGSNAHVILEEYIPPEHQQTAPSGRSNPSYFVPLSASNETQLRLYAQKLCDWLEQNRSRSLSCADLAYTLQVGREAMEARLGLIVRSVEELEEGLKAFLNPGTTPGHSSVAWVRGEVRKHKETIRLFTLDEDMAKAVDAWIHKRRFAKLAEFWVKGYPIDWHRLHLQQTPFRISLPTYPFIKTTYWWERTSATGQATDIKAAETTIAEAGSGVKTPSKRELQPLSSARRQLPEIEIAKPRITLPDLIGRSVKTDREMQAVGQQSQKAKTAKPHVSLSDLDRKLNGEAQPLRQTSHVVLHDDGQGIFSIQMASPNHEGVPFEAVMADLKVCFQSIQSLTEAANHNAKVVLFQGEEQFFFSGRSESRTAFMEQEIHRLPLDCRLPVIAVVRGQGKGLGCLLGSFCDVMICSRGAVLGYGRPQWPLSEEERAFFHDRFGRHLGEAILRAQVSGTTFQEKGQGMTVLPETELDDYVAALARRLSGFSQQSLMVLKKQLARDSVEHAMKLVHASTPIDGDGQGEACTTSAQPSVNLPKTQNNPQAQTPQRIRLQSQVITVDAWPNGVVLVSLCDRENKNMFSKAFLQGFDEAFEHIRGNAAYKVVIITGYDSYFACGGTKESLQAIQQGAEKFTDTRIYGRPLECEIPVIAAIQGHALGGGWSMGMYCDQVIFSLESLYQSPYMQFGFTPGAGSTLIFPHRFGKDFAGEILLSASAYRGSDFERQGIQMPVLPRRRVLAHAMEMANEMALSSRDELVETKVVRCQHLRHRLEETYLQELAMHEKTYVGNPDVFAKIQMHFNDGIQVEDRLDGIQEQPCRDRESEKAPVVSMQQVRQELRRFLAEELHMTPDMVEEDIEFVKMGLDSIIAVSWVQKINQAFGLALGATIVYTYTNLLDLLQHIFPEIAKAPSSTIPEPELAVSSSDSDIYPGFKPIALQPTVAAKKTGNANGSSLHAEKQKPTPAGRPDGAIGQGDLKDVHVKLRQLLAEELHMTPEAVEDDVSFVEMGLDSIIAVSWIQKINQAYGLSLEATVVYTYTTLLDLAQHIFPETATTVFTSTTRQPSANAVGEPEEKAVAMMAELRQLLAEELHMAAEAIEDDVNFVEMGLDYVMAGSWVQKLNQAYGLSLEATVIYTYTNLLDLAGHLASEMSHRLATARPLAKLERERPRRTPRADAKPVVSPPASQPLTPVSKRRLPEQKTGRIAIIGISGKFPKASTLDQFWENIAEGRNCVSEVPESRWSVDEFYDADGKVPGKTMSKWMGILEEVDQFDPLFFAISPRDAELMDPQQRLFLQACWSCIEDAGYNPKTLSGSSCGVFVGCDMGDYGRSVQYQELDAQSLLGGVVSILPARISYFLNLQGPCLAVDTACSSSLTAIANACDSLLLGHSDCAVAGGVCVMTGPEIHIMMSKAGMLSPNGTCFTFDQRANGFVPGEGVGAMFLKRYEDAVADGDPIYAVLRGWGINQDGKTNGITAPNARSQTRLEKRVYEQCGIHPEDIQLIEAHGTGTKLGDPIEVEGLRDAFAHFTEKQHYCALGSVKSNIGHLATAAGVSGMIKLVLALQHQKLPPTVNHEKLNEHIRLEGSPFYINTACRDWVVPEGKTRCAAISSFGFSGTNVHMVVEEHQPTENRRLTDAAPYLIVLSAKSDPQLEASLQQLLGFTRKHTEHAETTLHIADLAYTLQTGREAMTERLGLLVSSLDELADKLDMLLQQKSCDQIADCYRGTVIKQNIETFSSLADEDDIASWITKRQYAKVLNLWVHGAEIPWNSLYETVACMPSRIHMPTYPFAKERYWVARRKETGMLTEQNHEQREPTSEKADHEFFWKIEELIEEWERQQQYGGHLTPETLTKVFAYEVVKNLGPEQIHRVDQLLAATPKPATAPPPPVQQAAAVVPEPKLVRSEDIPQAVCEAISEVLKLQTIGEHDRFQDYGLDSISAMKLSVRLEEKLGRKVRPQWIHDFPSVGTLSRRLMEQDELVDA